MRIFAEGWSEEVDGPGRRWVLYLKGCNLHCPWCANPEGMSREVEVLFSPERPGVSERLCPRGALRRTGSGWALERALCRSCAGHPCATVYRHPAFVLAGETLTLERLLEMAQERRALFGPDGGITFGGGEATLQADVLIPALRALRRQGIHTALETNAATATFPEVCAEADLLLCDLKVASPGPLARHTGADAAQVRENLLLAARRGRALRLRCVLVPGVNAEPEERRALAELVREVASARADIIVEVLRVHHAGAPKWHALGRAWTMGAVVVPSREEALAWTAELERHAGVACRLAS